MAKIDIHDPAEKPYATSQNNQENDPRQTQTSHDQNNY